MFETRHWSFGIKYSLGFIYLDNDPRVIVRIYVHFIMRLIDSIAIFVY